MGVQTIIGLIERESVEEAAGIVAEAERTAQGLIAAAEADVAASINDALDRHGAELRAESQRRVNMVRLRVMEDRAALDAERLGDVFDLADARLRTIADGDPGDDPESVAADGGRWPAALATLAADALDSVGPGARMRVRRRDVPLLAELAAKPGVEVEAVDDMPPGILAISADGRIHVDASLPVRLARARTLLAEPVAALLSLRPGDVGPESERRHTHVVL